MKKTVVLVDAGTGNLRSVQKALESIDTTVIRTASPHQVAQARRIVLPGVGAFGDFINGLRKNGLEEGIYIALEKGASLLGICVGMQALFETGEEMGVHLGLGLLAGKVVRFPDGLGVKVPHTGWNEIYLKKDTALFQNLISPIYFYFNHSYYCQVEDQSEVIANCVHGIEFPAAVQRGRIFGVQFHPEKSQRTGITILRNFLEIADE